MQYQLPLPLTCSRTWLPVTKKITNSHGFRKRCQRGVSWYNCAMACNIASPKIWHNFIRRSCHVSSNILGTQLSTTWLNPLIPLLTSDHRLWAAIWLIRQFVFATEEFPGRCVNRREIPKCWRRRFYSFMPLGTSSTLWEGWGK